jgi:transcriptional regulator with XRE-family HTH domain
MLDCVTPTAKAISACVRPAEVKSLSSRFQSIGPHYGPSHMEIPIHFGYGGGNVTAMATIGERIRDRRKALKLRQGDLAELVGLDQSTISDIERGTGFGADVLMKLSVALRSNPYYVMNGEERITSGAVENVSQNETRKDDRDSIGVETFSGVQNGSPDAHLTIPTSMPYSPQNLQSTILLLGSLIGVLDSRSRSIIGEMLKDLALHTDDAEDIAEKASALATVQKPITKNRALNKALRGRQEAVESDLAPLNRR